MKEIKIQNFVRKYLKIRSHHRNEWDEECAYYSKEESQNDVFSRRVKKQIIQPFLNKFKVVGFSFVKNSNFHSYSDRDSCGLGVHWAYAPSFHVYDLMTYENSIMFQWFDLMELKIKGETLNAVEVDEICLFDGMSEAKCIAKLMKINRKMINTVETRSYAYGKENMIRNTYIENSLSAAMKDKKTPSYKKVQKLYEKLSQHEKDEIWKTCYDKAKEYNLLSLEDMNKDFLDKVIFELEN